MKALSPGQLVRAKAGRDKGRQFFIVGIIDEKHVYIADGDKQETRYSVHIHGHSRKLRPPKLYIWNFIAIFILYLGPYLAVSLCLV